MKFLLAAGILLFFGITSAGAQSGFSNLGTTVGGSSSINSATSVNRSPGINAVGAGAGSVNPRALKNVQGTNPGEFVPSTFESYDAALSLGENAMHARPLTLVEAANLAQQAKARAAAKPALILEKNAEGNLIVVPASLPGNLQPAKSAKQ